MYRKFKYKLKLFFNYNISGIELSRDSLHLQVIFWDKSHEKQALFSGPPGLVSHITLHLSDNGTPVKVNDYGKLVPTHY